MLSNTINDTQTIAGSGTGTVLAGRYRVIRQLGQGGMGSVWLAEDMQLDNKPFAIKMLPSILVSNKRAYRQLKDEALVAMKLVHPNIVQIRAFEENDGNPFLVMDYIEGQTLDDYLADYDSRVESVGRGDPTAPFGGQGSGRPTTGGLPEDEVIRILRPIAAALDYAHGEGVVHRDVKPANVMIRQDGHPFILDFGIAREIQETMTRVTGKLSSGTLLYMSPEQLNGDKPKKEQDIYSFAAMVYECLKGEPPFSRGQIEYQILNNPPPPLVGRGDPTAPLVPSVMAGLAKKPEDRPKSCTAVMAGEYLNRVSTYAEATVDKERAERVEGEGYSRVERAERVEGDVLTVGRGDPTAPQMREGGPPQPLQGAPSGKERKGGGAWKAFLSMLVLGVVIGGGVWFYNQRQRAARKTELERITMENDDRKIMISKLQEENKQLRQQIKPQDDQIPQLQAQIEELRQQIQKLKAEKAGVETTKEKLLKSNELYVQGLANATNGLAKIRADYSMVTRTNSELRARLAKSEKEKDEIALNLSKDPKARESALDKKASDLKKKSRELEKREDKLKADEKELVMELKKLNKEKEDLKDKQEKQEKKERMLNASKAALDRREEQLKLREKAVEKKESGLEDEYRKKEAALEKEYEEREAKRKSYYNERHRELESRLKEYQEKEKERKRYYDERHRELDQKLRTR